MKYLSTLFDGDRPEFLTEIAGPVNAAYVPFTPAAQLIYGQLFDIFDRHGLEYFVFAGSLVGYVRDATIPPWMDDIDVIVFEDQIPLFTEIIVPVLKTAGFYAYVPREYPGGGYHVLSLREAEKSDANVAFSDDCRLKIPRAQVDVFFTRTNAGGYLRNLDGWGLYHHKDVPIDWVRPAKRVRMFDRMVPVFAEYEKDIFHEYGDILNTVVVYSHGKTFARLEGVRWSDVATEFQAYLDHLDRQTLPGLDAPARDLHDPIDGLHMPQGDDSFVTLVRDLLKARASDVILTRPKHFLWVLDLRKQLPKLKIHARLEAAQHCSRVSHLRRAYDTVEVPDPALRDRYYEQLFALGGPAQPKASRSSAT